jgi:hypothetical protein
MSHRARRTELRSSPPGERCEHCDRMIAYGESLHDCVPRPMRLFFHRDQVTCSDSADVVATYTVWSQDPVADHTEEVTVEVVGTNVWVGEETALQLWPRVVAYGDAVPVLEELLDRDVLDDRVSLLELEEAMSDAGVEPTPEEER